MNRDLRRKKNVKGSERMPFLLLIGFMLAIFVVLMSSITTNKDSNKANINKEIEHIDISQKWNSSMLAVLKERDSMSKILTFLDVNSGQDIKLSYTGSSDIRDKYNQVISASQLIIGDMLDVYYDNTQDKLIALNISSKAWEYKGISNWLLNENVIEIAGTKYKYGDKTVISRGSKLLERINLDYTDELTVKGYDKEVWSIIVTKGHGTLTFTEYEDFYGGIAYIGKGAILPIVEGLVITVREGNYDITFEHGSLLGTKTVAIGPEDDITVSMEEFKLPPKQMCVVEFDIYPNGADLFINDKEYSYQNAIELEYGKYDVKVSLGGYTTYTGRLEVNDGYKMVNINLVEVKEEESDNTVDGQENDNTVDEEENNGDENEDRDSEEIIDRDNSSGYIYIKEPVGASAYFDGEFKGTVPVSFKKEEGTHYVTLIMSGYQTKTYTVNIEDDNEDITLSFPEMTKEE